MFEHMLIPLDGSHLAECVLPHATALSRAFGARVTLLRVLERAATAGPGQSVDPLGWHMRKAEATSYLDGVGTRLQEVGLRTEQILLEGQAAQRIVEFARTHDVGLILVSSHGRSGLSYWNVSSVVEKIILSSRVPTMIVRAYLPVTSDLASLRYQRLLVPLDCSQRAECALPLATTLARFYESQLLLAHVVVRPEMPRRAPLTQEEIELANRLTERNRLEANRCLEQLRSQLHPDVQLCLLVGDNVAAALHELVKQEDVDLVVLSAHGYSGGARWPYGSVALNFIAYGTTPLLIVQDLSQDELESTQVEMAAREYKGH
jgi:nucleotide-binding universal stress UspA family protein